jgi:LemA protein
MSGSLLLWTTLALLLFWGVGLYNRLMRMRARGFSAFGSIEKHLREYEELARVQAQRFQVGLHDVPLAQPDECAADWMGLLSALQVVDHALKDARANPLGLEQLVVLAKAMLSLREAWEALRAAPADLAGPVVPNDMRLQWDTITRRVEASRNGYNQILLKYNEALGQFPARLIAGLMGFQPGGML